MTRFAVATLVAGAVALLAYLGLVWATLRQEPSVPILAYVTDNSYPYIPRAAARLYLSREAFDPNAEAVLDMPVFNFLVNAYGLEGPQNDARVLELSEQFIKKCAAIDRKHQGLTPLHAAVLGNSVPMVRLLVAHGADPQAKIEKPESRFNQMTAAQLAEALAPRRPDAAALASALKPHETLATGKACPAESKVKT